MTVFLLFIATAAIFLVVDAVMLSLVMRPLFERHIGDQLLDDIRIVPAALFYLCFIAGVIWLVSLPALRAGVPLQALIGGAVIGAMAYGTYEFTSFAVMKNWHWTMVAADVAWGTVLTGFSAWAGVVITRALT